MQKANYFCVVGIEYFPNDCRPDVFLSMRLALDYILSTVNVVLLERKWKSYIAEPLCTLLVSRVSLKFFKTSKVDIQTEG